MYRYIKRVLDYFLVIVTMPLTFPVMAVIALLVKMTSPGPALFCQRRIGLHKKEFIIYKFRSMRTDSPGDVPTHMLQSPDMYITGIGRFLRKSSLDELPQLLNVLKGDISLVGPRPALFNQYDLIAERDLYGANDVLPGITGLAQIKGRDDLAIPVKAKLDGEYAANVSFCTDIGILFGTVMSVISGKGVKEGSANNDETLHEES